MKIAIVIQDITTHGGTERTSCRLASEMARNGHTVHLVSLFHQNGGPQYAIDASVQVEYLSDIAYSLQMCKIQRLCAVGKMIGAVKHCSILAESDIIITEKLLASVVVWRAGWAYKSIACHHYRYAMYGHWMRKFRDFVFSKFAQLVVLSETDKEAFLQHTPNVTVIPNMIPIEIHPYAGSSCHRMIGVGRLTKDKGFDILLQALAQVKIKTGKLNEWQVDIFGEGVERDNLEKQCKDLHLEDIVHFCGTTNTLEKEYAQAGIFVLPSRMEGLPMVLVEAAACGLPIIATACAPGIEEMLGIEDALVCDVEDTKMLADAIETLISNPSLREQLSARGQYIIAPYMPMHIYNKWMNLITTIQIPCKTI